MATPNDPLFSSQWYLQNTGQRGSAGIDINIVPVWSSYTGKGMIVAVNDDGMDLTHPDLKANILTNLVFDTSRGTTGQGFQTSDNSHGTVVGAVIGESANNGIGGVGIAYDAKLVPGLAVGTTGNMASLFLSNLAAGASVSCNSWGQDPAFTENFSASSSTWDREWGEAMLRCVTEARGGLGMVIEVSAGNERGNKADAAMSNFTGGRYTIAVGAVDEKGVATDYSTRGASLLVTAPGGVASSSDSNANTGYGIISADVQGASGFNTTAGTAGDYQYQMEGTSFSGPMVSAVAALMLQANRNLGFRDVSNILAMTARKNDASASSWVTTHGASTNMGGMHFSRDYGFGLIDATAAVHLAESWNATAQTVANWQKAEGTSAHTSASIPDNDPAGLTLTATVQNNISIDRVEVDLGMTAHSPSQLMATLTSPAGTTITLFDQPLNRPLADGAPDMSVPETAWPGVFTIGATAFLGEQSAGTWTLKVIDKVTGETATYNSFTVRAWGSDIGNDSNYVFTNEFSGTKTLSDNVGKDTINASAVATSVQLNLNAGTTSSIASGKLMLDASTNPTVGIGGDGDDTITGNTLANVLRGNRNNDSIDGSAGLDTAVYRGNRANYNITKTATGYTIKDNASDEGTDTLVNVERIQFADTNVGLDQNGTGGQAFRLYQAAFNRTPDLAGLGWQMKALDAGTSLTQLSASFMASAEFKSMYGEKPSSTQLVGLLYNNVLHRTPQQFEVDFWVNILDKGEPVKQTPAEVLMSFSESQENQAQVLGSIQNGFDYIFYA